MISSASQMLYSASAVRRILAIAAGVQVKVKELHQVIWVWVKGKRPTFISKRVFKQHFAEWRKAQSRGLVATQWLYAPHQFTVRNESKNTIYSLECRPDGVFCTCEDFNNQLAFFGKGCCKHGYAVLAKIGFTSLADYIQHLSRLSKAA